jgi:hypothetical protein
LRAQIDEHGGRVAGRVQISRWRVAGRNRPCTLDFDAEGAIDFAAKRLTLRGRTSFEILAARIDGEARLSARPTGVDVAVEGALRWQGRPWLQGRVSAGTSGVTIAGRTAFALDLTPSNLASIELAHLFLRLDIAGSFTLAKQTTLAAAEIEGDWMLAVRLPGVDGQVLPIAAQRLHVEAAASLPVQLIKIEGFTLVGFRGISIPLPKITGKGKALRFGKKNGNMAASWSSKSVELIGGLVPVVSEGNLTAGQTDYKVQFDFDVSWDTENAIKLDLPLSGTFTLALVWRPSGKLAIEVRRGNVSKFVALG